MRWEVLRGVESEAQVPFEVQIARFVHRFEKRKDTINQRLEDFSNIDKSDQRLLFEELAFCLMTPQSKARTCDAAVKNLKEKGLLFAGSAEEVAQNIPGVRFQNNKSRWIVEAREKFPEFKLDFSDIVTLRDNLVTEFKGLGYKEASHFLRNIGYGDNIAILDRHILKNLVKVGVIEKIPTNITPKLYFSIEEKMREFCQRVGISLAQLDLLFWSEEAGEVFK